jgi:hypothetical protein
MSAEWEEVLRKVNAFQERATKRGSVVWYRGHRSSTWTAKSTLHRHVEDLVRGAGWDVPDFDKIDLLREEYKTLYYDFLSDAWPLLGPDERSDWGVIFSMQHHGVPTRLMDWTESFACALYFAQLDRPPTDEAAIYALDPHGLNLQSINRDGLVFLPGDAIKGTIDNRLWHPKYATPAKDLRTIAVKPPMTNKRMLAQRAAFTLSGDSFLPLEGQFAGKLGSEGYIEKITLPPQTFPDAESFVGLIGIGHYGYFPDFEGLREKFRQKKATVLRNVRKYYPPPS